MPTDFFNRHRATLEQAVTALQQRGYWSPYSESPSPRIYGEGAAEAGDVGGEEGDGAGDHCVSRAKVISVEPSVIVSPSLSFARLTRLPLTSIPFVEPRSTIQYAAPSWRNSAWRRDTFASAS